jgi:hypothetical protein
MNTSFSVLVSVWTLSTKKTSTGFLCLQRLVNKNPVEGFYGPGQGSHEYIIFGTCICVDHDPHKTTVQYI